MKLEHFIIINIFIINFIMIEPNIKHFEINNILNLLQTYSFNNKSNLYFAINFIYLYVEQCNFIDHLLINNYNILLNENFNKNDFILNNLKNTIINNNLLNKYQSLYNSNNVLYNNYFKNNYNYNNFKIIK